MTKKTRGDSTRERARSITQDAWYTKQLPNVRDWLISELISSELPASPNQRLESGNREPILKVL